MMIKNMPGRRFAVALALMGVTVGGAVAQTEPASPPLFEDVTAALGVDFAHQNGMTGKLYFAEMAGSGAALFDADGDGDLDLYVMEGGPLEPVADGQAEAKQTRPSDRLYRNDRAADGTHRFVDVTKGSGLEKATGYGMGVAVGDVDDDGRVDLYLTNLGNNQLWRNVSAGGRIAFEDITAAAGVEDPRWSVPAVFFDYDADGRLDLYIGNYVDFRLATHKTCSGPGAAPDYCGPSSYRPEPDRLFRRLDGDSIRFEDVTEQSGLLESGAALGAVADDFDGDGLLDLYVANDGEPNRLYLNQGPGADARFVDDALLAGTAVNQQGQPEASMGVVAGDVDGNGSPDLFMTHLALETNTLYLNDGLGMFEDRSRESGLGNASWRFTGFGTALADFDVDGHADLFVVNGAVLIDDAQRSAGDPHPLKQTDLFFRGLGGGRFVDATALAGPALGEARVSRGLAAGDLDDDGDPDLVVTNNLGPAIVLRNTTDPSPDRWLGLRVLTQDGKRDAYGAKLRIRRAGHPDQWRRVGPDGSYGSSSDARVLVGWPDSSASQPSASQPSASSSGIDVEVRWLDGKTERFTGFEPGRYRAVRQGTGAVVTASDTVSTGADGP